MKVATSTVRMARDLNGPAKGARSSFLENTVSNDLKDFMVSLRVIPERGPAKILVEMNHPERDMVGHAASLVGLSKQKFTRAVIISAAERVFKEKGVKPIA